MDKMLPLYLLVGILSSFQLHAQVLRCGTPQPNQTQRENLARARSQQNHARNTGTTCVPLKIYAFREDGGSGGITQAALTEGLNFLNYYYLAADIEFYYCGGITYINNSDLYDYDLRPADGDTESALISAAGQVSNAVNVYIVDKITISDDFQASGYAYLPYGDNNRFNRIVMTENGINDHPGGTFVHEFGHYFSLLHTFEGTQDGNMDADAEHVARTGAQSNCGTAGDQLCDTEADPGFSTATFSFGNCTYTGGEADVFGTTYTPPVDNIMSYYPTFCPPRVLTSGQYGFIAGGLGVRQGYTSYSLDCSPTAVNVPTNVMATLNDDENGVLLNWTDVANNEFGYLVERSTTSAATGFEPLLYGFTGPNGTSYTDNDIQSNQQYWYRIKPANGDCDTYSVVATISLGTLYCGSIASGVQACDDDEYIARVIFGRTFNNGTECTAGGYENYTHLSIAATQGSTYNIRVNNGVVSGGVPTELRGFTGDQCGLWVDWNQDGDFEDSEEAIALDTDDAPIFWTTSLTIPNTAALGDTRMRVRIVYNETPSACGLSTFGETEDYTLRITSTPLPVELSAFTATPKGRVALLEWQTLTESNNDFFSIEHSLDARSFTTLGAVKGHGTTFTPQSYDFTDLQPSPGTNYYRLRQVDFDGQYEYSDMRTVVIPDEPAHLLIYPNPSRGIFHIQVPQGAAESAYLQLFDSQGRMLRQRKIVESTKLTNTMLGEEPLAPGLYFLRWQDEQRSFTERLMIQN